MSMMDHPHENETQQCVVCEKPYTPKNPKQVICGASKCFIDLIHKTPVSKFVPGWKEVGP